MVLTAPPPTTDQTGAESLPIPSRFSVVGIKISAATYASATNVVMQAARARRSLLLSAAAVHMVTVGATEAEYGEKINAFDMIVPDGQPVRWALRLLHGVKLPDRVYGPTLMLNVCEEAARTGVGIYLYGGRPEVLDHLRKNLVERFPGLRIQGFRSPPFRPTTPEEDADDVRDILESGAEILFIGLGCPRQDNWAFEHRDRLPLPTLCVGAAFDFHAGAVRQAPPWMQRVGLEWAFRLASEPRRLWKRYATYNPLFVALVLRQMVCTRSDRLAVLSARMDRQSSW
jgi:N-acetylglucosaminyldiphosphoundecaprenol N-acetyl-beta-D-mannosaminyltransferase